MPLAKAEKARGAMNRSQKTCLRGMYHFFGLKKDIFLCSKCKCVVDAMRFVGYFVDVLDFCLIHPFLLEGSEIEGTDENQVLLVLWTTSRCNLRCRYCYAAGKPAANMEWETAKAAVDRLSGGHLRIQFAGGEPTLNLPLIERVAQYVAGRNVPLAIQTNAVSLSDYAVELICRHRIAVGVSMDGKPEVNEALRGSTKQALEGAQRLREAGVMLNLNAVVTAENVDRLPEMADLALWLGNVGGIGLDLLRHAGRASASGAPREAHPEQIGDMLRALHRRLVRLNRLSPCSVRLREVEEARMRLTLGGNCSSYCYASVGRSWVVLPDGEIYPCGSLAGDARYRMGNVRDEIQPLRLPGARWGACIRCKFGRVCPGACPSRALLCGGFSPQDCALRKASFEIAQEEIQRKAREE